MKYNNLFKMADSFESISSDLSVQYGYSCGKEDIKNGIKDSAFKAFERWKKRHLKDGTFHTFMDDKYAFIKGYRLAMSDDLAN